MDEMEKLEAAWLNLCAGLGISSDIAKRIFLDFCRRYSEPQRHYHGLSHIISCVKEFALIRAELRDRAAVLWAVFFHDAVYDPASFDNEEKSAKLAVLLAKEAGLSLEFQDKVARFILASKEHGCQEDFDAQAMLDIDLAILGKEAFECSEYETDIRREYSFLPEGEFRRGRGEILKEFLRRDSVYQTEFFRGRYELRARKNLAFALRSLER